MPQVWPSCDWVVSRSLRKAAGHPKTKFGEPEIVFPGVSDKSLRNTVLILMATDHPKEHFVCLKLCFGVSSVVAAAVSSKELEWPLLACKTF